MSDPENGTRQFALRRSPRLGQFALRRSPRLLAKSAMTKPQRSRIAPRKLSQCSQLSTREHRKPTQSRSESGSVDFWTNNWYKLAPDYAVLKQDKRRTEDRKFHRGYNCFGMEKRTILTSGGERHIRCDKSTGVMWVAVCWLKSICVVYRKEDLEQQKESCLTGYLHKSQIQRFFAPHLVCEIEDIADPSRAVHQQVDLSDGKPFAVGMLADIADPSSAIHQQLDLSDGKPFAVVCVCPGPSNAHEETYAEASVAVPGENKAIEFLRSKMKDDASFVTYSHVVQTTIDALQHLFQQKFKGDEIRVVELKDGSNLSGLMPVDIDKHLAIINKAVSQDSLANHR